jgi:hypothetical protein
MKKKTLLFAFRFNKQYSEKWKRILNPDVGMLISRYNLHTHLSLCHSFPVSYYESINTDVSGRVGWVTRGVRGVTGQNCRGHTQGKAQGKA